MTFLQSLTEWIAAESDDVVELDGVDVVQMGQAGDLEPPFIGLIESGASLVESNGVVMHGVTQYDITAELHTIPAEADEQGTTFDEEREMRVALYDILADRDSIDATSEENGFRVFDIRATGPTTESEDGRRITRFQITAIVCPI